VPNRIGRLALTPPTTMATGLLFQSVSPVYSPDVNLHSEGRSTATPLQEGGSGVPGISPAEVRAALHDILQSDAFGMSKRCGDFLSYVVEQTVVGLQHELKERTIAVAVFGREASYDTHEDAIVRIKASEVRKRLGHYYGGSGKTASIQISLPPGGYTPTFSRVVRQDPREGAGVALMVESGTDSVLNRIPPPKALEARSFWRVGAWPTISVVLLAILLLAWFKPWAKSSFLTQFWGSVLRDPAPVFLVTASAPVYVSYDDSTASPTHKAGTEYVLVADQYIGQGDMLASDLISSMLRNLGHKYEVKLSSNVDFRDLTKHSVVLIGYSSTQWQAISKDFRFFIDDERSGMVTDRGQPTEWYPHHLTKDLHTDEDYAVISRVFDPETRAMVVLVSGSTQYGTEGAAQLVTNADLLRDALHDRPPGWETKNLQVVLHMKVIANSPAAAEAVASYYW